MLIALAVIVLLGYWVIPEVFFHLLRQGVLHSGDPHGNRIALTFDDGPGEATGEILDLLKAHGARATFFVLGLEAPRKRAAIKRMVEEGHEVALHGMRHRSAWQLGPVATHRQIADGLDAVVRAGAPRPKLFRPPWGHMNAFTLWAAAREGVRVALWNRNPGDWLPGRRHEGFAARLLKGAKPGAVILLHDAGGDGRRRTVEVLRNVLPQLSARRLEMTTMSELVAEVPRTTPLLRRLWDTWERLFERLYRVDDIPGEDSIFRLSITSYSGPPFTAEDGTEVHPGDRCGEVHFKNDKLSKAGAIRAMRLLRGSMKALAEYVRTSEKYRDIQLFLGVTVLHAPAEAFGFSVRPLEPTLSNRWAAFYRRMLMVLYHPAGVRSLRRRDAHLEAKLVYITRKTLLGNKGRNADSK